MNPHERRFEPLQALQSRTLSRNISNGKASPRKDIFERARTVGGHSQFYDVNSDLRYKTLPSLYFGKPCAKERPVLDVSRVIQGELNEGDRKVIDRQDGEMIWKVLIDVKTPTS